MTDHAILTFDTAIRLIAARKTDLVPKLFGVAWLPGELQTDLRELDRRPAQDAFSLYKVRDPGQLHPDAQAMLTDDKITQDKAVAISLAKELTRVGDDRAFVLTEDKTVSDHLYTVGPDIRIFTANFWTIMFRASDKRLLDWIKERPALEKACPITAETKDQVDRYDKNYRERLQQQQEQQLKKELEQARKRGHIH